MYQQNRLDIENQDKDIEEKIKSVFEIHSVRYGYRRITATLRDATKFKIYNSYSISESPNFNYISRALNKAINSTSDCKFRRTFNSNQTGAYQMNKYSELLNYYK